MKSTFTTRFVLPCQHHYDYFHNFTLLYRVVTIDVFATLRLRYYSTPIKMPRSRPGRPLTSCRYFNKLPTEIRLEIWRLALHDSDNSRNVEFFVELHREVARDPLSFNVTSPNTLSTTTVESRNVARKLCSRYNGSGLLDTTITINWSIDHLYLCPYLLRNTPNLIASRCQHLTISWNLQQGYDDIVDFLLKFKSLRTLRILWNRGHVDYVKHDFLWDNEKHVAAFEEVEEQAVTLCTHFATRLVSCRALLSNIRNLPNLEDAQIDLLWPQSCFRPTVVIEICQVKPLSPQRQWRNQICSSIHNLRTEANIFSLLQQASHRTPFQDLGACFGRKRSRYRDVLPLMERSNLSSKKRRQEVNSLSCTRAQDDSQETLLSHRLLWSCKNDHYQLEHRQHLPLNPHSLRNARYCGSEMSKSYDCPGHAQ